jgi:hypothetical protein
MVAAPPLPLTAVINVDGFGMEPSLRAIRTGYAQSGNWLADMAAASYAARGTQVQWVTGGDDSMAFQRAGLTALGLGQQPTQPWPGAFHTPDDSLERLHLATIDETANTLVALIDHLAVHPATETSCCGSTAAVTENAAPAARLRRRLRRRQPGVARAKDGRRLSCRGGALFCFVVRIRFGVGEEKPTAMTASDHAFCMVHSGTGQLFNEFYVELADLRKLGCEMMVDTVDGCDGRSLSACFGVRPVTELVENPRDSLGPFLH